MKQNIGQQEQIRKLKIVLDNAGANLCQIWNGMNIKDIPVESVYKKCDDSVQEWDDLDELKWYFNQAPSKIVQPENKGYTKTELDRIARIRAEYLDGVRHADRRNGALIFMECPPGTQRCKECTQNSGTGNVAAQPLYDFYKKFGKFPSPTPDPSLPGHFLNFLQLFRSDKGESALPDEFLPSLNAKVGAAELDSTRCAICALKGSCSYVFSSMADKNRHFRIVHQTVRKSKRVENISKTTVLPKKLFCKICKLNLRSLRFLRAHQKKTGHHNLARKVKKSRSELTIKQEGTASCYFKSPVPDIPCVTQTGYNNRNKKRNCAQDTAGSKKNKTQQLSAFATAEPQTAPITSLHSNNFEMLVGLELHVPCDTWLNLKEEEARNFFGSDYDRGYVKGNVIKAISKKFPTFVVRFESLDLTSDKQPLSYVLKYGQNIPCKFFEPNPVPVHLLANTQQQLASPSMKADPTGTSQHSSHVDLCTTKKVAPKESKIECQKNESERKLLRTLKNSHLQFMMDKAVKSVIERLFSAELLESLQCFLKNPSAEKGIVKASDFYRILGRNTFVSNTFLTSFQTHLQLTSTNIYFLDSSLYSTLELEKQNAPVIPNIDTYEYVFLNIHQGGNHWAAAAIPPPTNSTILYVNSIKNSNPPSNLIAIINALGAAQHPSRKYNVVERLMVPEQEENECGMAVNEFARRLCNSNNDSLFDDWKINAVFLRVSQAHQLWGALQDDNFIQAISPF